ncbi:hypothetical protein [Lysinibacillus irui]|uniref:hypothetical protein n=1 Tax=Lysinibacillus irui TaxID=2998077 RepID=UPI002AD3CF50|nr:hypothetical protein [Lysinibacillus irui]MEA0564471.1 hypothetical protein [Lysinibacillus irui]
MEIKYKDFLTVSDFFNKHILLESEYVLNKNTIRRNAVTNGKPPWKGVIPQDVLKWKLSLVDTFIDFTPSNTRVKIKNIQALEESEVRIVSFTLGMLFAQCYAQKFMGVNQLYHLKNLIKDKVITVSTKGKYPDFVGFNRSFDEVYLIEAKGSSTRRNYMSNQTIKEASEQLQSVLSIVTHQIVGGSSYDKLYFGANLKKFIVATHPDLQNNLTQEVIDPTEGTNCKLVMDADKAVYSYYEHLLFLLNHSIKSEVPILKRSYMVFDIPEYNCSIGLLSDLYDILNTYYNKDSRKINSEGLKGKVDEILKDFKEESELGHVSIGYDGIISMDKE